MTPPDRDGAPTSLAPHHLRLFALIVDYLLIITLLKLLDQLAMGAHWDLRPAAAGGSAVSVWWAAGLIGLMLCKDVVNGQSIGKWLTGIAVAAMPGLSAAPGLKRAVLRNLTLLILPIDGVFVFRDRYGRRLGDRLAGTVVVVPAGVPHLMRRLIVMAILFLLVMLTSFLVAPWNMKRSAAYQEAYRIAAGHPTVTRAVGAPARPDSSPAFKLSLQEGGGSAEIVFEVEGARGKGQAEIVLRLLQTPPRWELETVRFTVQGEEEQEPLTRKAPPQQ